MKVENTQRIDHLNNELNIKYFQDVSFISLQGYSIGNVSPAYESLLNVIQTYLSSEKKVTLKFDLQCYDALTLEYLSSIIRILNQETIKGKKVALFWSLNDEEIPSEIRNLYIRSFFDFDFTTQDSEVINPSIVKSKLNCQRKFQLISSSATRLVA